jgi:hypothetical protein
LKTAADLGIELRFLPRATPELNSMDHLWPFVKGCALADRLTRSVDGPQMLLAEIFWQCSLKSV